MSPLETIEKYNFEHKYRVSPDKKMIYAFNADGTIAFGYSQESFIELNY